MLCSVCDKNATKYKCPKCFIKYCSLECYKIHRLEPCDRSVEKPEDVKPAIENYNFITSDTIPIEKLRLLDHSDAVRSTLYNPHVRSILDAIDKSQNPVSILKNAMLEPIFVEFVEECLKVVDPDASDKENVCYLDA